MHVEVKLFIILVGGGSSMCAVCKVLQDFGDWEDALEMVRKAGLEAAISGVHVIPEEHLDEAEDFAHAIQWIETGVEE